MKFWLNKHPLLAPVFLIAVIIAVYFPAMESGIHPYDDPGIIAHYSKLLPLSQILLPGSGYYYRPLVELSFWFDNMLWGMEPSAMHLELVLLHCINSLLVYMLAVRLQTQNTGNRIVPLFAALLFALHPVNVEAVAWIAGRTDPLLTLFVLLSLIYWLRWIAAPDWRDLFAVSAFYGAALLSKETALAFGAVLALLTMAWPGAAKPKQRVTAVAMMSMLPVVAAAGFMLVFHGKDSGLGRFLSSTDLQVMQAVPDTMIAFGFYLKKLIIPLPLNFAIDTVQPWYALPGLLFFPIIWLLFRYQRKTALLFVAAMLCIMPALLVAVKQVAWTHFAERYLYLPSAFFVLGFAVAASGVWESQKKLLAPVAVGLIFLFFVISLQRVSLWNDKLAFFEDAVSKSPAFGSVYYTLGGLLIQKGEINRAADLFLIAEKLNQRDSMRHPIKVAIMGAMIAKGDFLEARDYFFKLFNKKQDAPADFLELLYKADIKRLEKLAGNDKVMLAIDLIETLTVLNQKKPDPFWLYQSGRMAMITADTSKAADYFRRAYTAAPPDAHYRGAALTNLRRLEQTQ